MTEPIHSAAHVKYLREEVLKLRRENGELATENKMMKNRLVSQEPLVKTAVAIRRRFFEHAKNHRGFEKPNEAIIEAGYHAGNRGDLRADLALFDLGHMDYMGFPPLDSVPPIDPVYNELFLDLYTVPYSEYFHASIAPWNISHTEERFLNLCATMNSHSLFDANEASPGSDDFKLFKSMAVGYVKRTARFGEKHKDTYATDEMAGKAARNKDIDECPQLAAYLEVMSEIVERTVEQGKAARTRQKGGQAKAAKRG